MGLTGKSAFAVALAALTLTGCGAKEDKPATASAKPAAKAASKAPAKAAAKPAAKPAAKKTKSKRATPENGTAKQ